MNLGKIIQISVFFIIFSVISCFHRSNDNDSLNNGTNVLKKIQERGTLTAITVVNSTGYYLYKGIPMGFHYDLLKKFADYLGVELRILVTGDLTQAYRMINSGKADIIACDLTVTDERRDFLSFSIPLFQTSQVLVYRKGAYNPFLQQSAILTGNSIRQIEVYVPKASSFINTLQKFAKLKHGKVKIIEKSDYYQEDLIKLVSDEKVDYTVSDYHIANLICSRIGNLDYSTGISESQNISWAVDKDATMLVNELNKWLTDFKKTTLFKFLYKKYYQSPGNEEYTRKYLHSPESKKISKLDPYIRQYAKIINWDWRLLASLIYQESQFQSNLVSRKGAFGVMQLMPQTANYFGIDTLSSASQQILAGVKYLQFLERSFPDINDSAQLIKFVLSSYNSGPGHTLDARRLAKKYNKNPNVWENNVDSFVLKKSFPKYYKDPVVRHGYSRGYESFKLVNEVIERFYHYKNLIPY